MRFLHTADWHIGKNLAGYDLLADQAATFKKIEQIAKDQQVDAIVIAGDLYDRSVPSEAAINELDRELIQLNLKDHFPLLAISGNHDSATRLGVGREWYQATDFFLNTDFNAAFQPVTVKDTQFFLLPYFGLQQVKNYFHDDSLRNLNSAMKAIVTQMQTQFDPQKAHVLVAHFYANGAQRVDSDTNMEIGGLSAVDTAIMAPFDYVALGHLHSRNALKEERVRYSGSPMKFSASEANLEKGVWIVDTDSWQIDWQPLTPVHQLRVLTASFAQLTDPEFAQYYSKEDYFVIKLTDRQVIPDVMTRLREYYPQIISLERKNGFQAPHTKVDREAAVANPVDLLQKFYEETTNNPLSKQQLKWAVAALKQAQKEN